MSGGDCPLSPQSSGNSASFPFAVPILTPEERIGQVLAGRYKLESVLGQGGMGYVMGGQHELTGR